MEEHQDINIAPEPEDRLATRVQVIVRAVSEGKLRIKRKVPIVPWEPPAVDPAVKIRHLHVVESACPCEEAWFSEPGDMDHPPINRRLPVSITEGARHDCKYVVARNSYFLSLFPKLKSEAFRAACEATSNITEPAMRNGERNMLEGRYLDQLITAKMNQWRYEP